MEHLEVGDLRLVASLGQHIEAHIAQVVDATHEHVLLTEQIGFGLLGEGGLDGACAQSAQSLGVSQAQRPGLAIRILLHSHNDRNATAGGVLTTNDVARALRGDHEHRMILGRLDVAVVDVEAVSESQSSARLQVRLNVLLVHGGLVLVRQQDHHNVGFGNGLGNRLDLEALLLGVFHGLRGRTQADDDIHTGIAQVQRVGVTLGTVTEDGHLLAIEHGQIGILLVPDSCCHNRRSFIFLFIAIRDLHSRTNSRYLILVSVVHSGRWFLGDYSPRIVSEEPPRLSCGTVLVPLSLYWLLTFT